MCVCARVCVCVCACVCVCVRVCVCVHFSQGYTAPSSKHTLPAVRTSSQVGVGKGCEVHRADLKWLKSSLQCLFYAFREESEKAELELFPCSQRARIRGEKERDGGGERSGPQRLRTVMHFRLKSDHGQLEEEWLTW